MTIILGIETGCDDTAVALISGHADSPVTVVAEHLSTQHGEHAPYGGVVPEIAARSHAAALPGAVREVLAKADITPDRLDAVAVTAGPGLIGGLITGVAFAQGLAAACGKPLLGVHHLHAHALSPRITQVVPYPYPLLLISGGHCMLLAVGGVGDIKMLGGTRDDSPGEAFDKLGKLLGLDYPGGPAVEKAAASGDPQRFALPRPLVGNDGFDFSFSGLKTAALRLFRAQSTFTDQDRADLCAAFQAAVADCLADRWRRALRHFAGEHGNRYACAAGGAAANGTIRAKLTEVAAEEGFEAVLPPKKLCTDNGVMIAYAGLSLLAAGADGTVPVKAFAGHGL